MEIKQWLVENKLNALWVSDNVFEIDGVRFCVIQPKQGKIIQAMSYEKSSQYELATDDGEVHQSVIHQCKYYTFFFGRWWYYAPCTSVKIEFNPLKYFGKAKCDEKNMLASDYIMIGVHGGYELSNGSRSYNDWCAKAKFLGIDTLGICEYNTLAGTLPFQLACEKNKIKPIIGESIRVKSGKDYYTLKLYVKNEEGWRNLLKNNTDINVHNHGYVEEEKVLERGEGLVVVFTPSVQLTKELIAKYSNVFDHKFYQFDPVQFSVEEKDQAHLDSLKNWYLNHSDNLKPLLINDAYYLDKDDAHIKRKLNAIGKVTTDFSSQDQYFKTPDDLLSQITPLFKDEYMMLGILSLMSHAHKGMKERCTFKIPLGELHLPEYELSSEQLEQCGDAETLFWDLLNAGMERKVIEKGKDVDIYIERLSTEIEVINSGNLRDYFLILWDIFEWCKKQGIKTGAGRGSAAGSLISYLLDITKLDPIEHGLLFERFLNAGRVGKKLPDIDSDIAGERRGEVKRYMESKYGVEHVTSIGTYTTLKLKAAIKDLGRLNHLTPQYMNYTTAVIPNEGGTKWVELFDLAIDSPHLKEFLLSNTELVNDIQLILNQPKTPSVHAAGVVITPKKYKGKDMTIFDWMPVKKMDGVLVSEWEGPMIEAAGFLKEDILGIKQLDKFDAIMKLIVENGNKPFWFEDIDYEDKHVYDLFQRGLNQDLFHFGSKGLTSYSTDVKPKTFADLIAMIALYRPGVMETGGHQRFVAIRNGDKEEEFEAGLEEITKETFSLLVYQEQVIKAVQYIGGLNAVEADEVRAGMGKKQLDKIAPYRKQFIEGGIERGYEEHHLMKLWTMFEGFASYAFNKSHAAVYAMTGYFCQFLKYYYPMEFWTIALQYADDTEISSRVSELSKLQDHVRLMPPDINESDGIFRANFKDKSIYWAITKIKQVGEKTVDTIIQERTKKGKFYSMEEFRSRLPKSEINKRTLLHLILAGCFDKIEGIKNVAQRMKLIEQLCKWTRDDVPTEMLGYPLTDDYYWILIQKNLTGFGFLNYTEILKKGSIPDGEKDFLTPDKILLESNEGCYAVVGGILNEVMVKRTKNGKTMATLVMECNNDPLTIVMWEELWLENGAEILKAQGRILFLSGTIVFDKYRKHNTLRTDKMSFIEIV